jgi:hypothetical protein
MCIQCMATAMTAGAAATGGRVWLAAHSPRWMTPRRLKAATAAILAVGVLAAGSGIAPNGSDARAPSEAPPVAAQR